MLNQLNRIKELIPYLPSKDAAIAKKFYENRDWESLKDLTWSSLQILEKYINKESLPDKYKGIDLDKVRELALECNDYYYLIFPNEDEVEDDFDDEEEI